MEIKTLLNCDTYEFFKALNSMRNDIDNYFKVTKINDIVYKSYDIPEDLDEKEREKRFIQQGNERFNKVVVTCFGENLDLTYDFLTKVCFGNEEYVKSLGEVEIVNFIFKFFTHKRVIPFFATYKPME